MRDMNDRAARLVTAIDRSDFPEALVSHLGERVAFDAATIFVHRRELAPIYVFDNFVGGKAKQGVREYLQKTYALNPFFQAQRNGLASASIAFAISRPIYSSKASSIMTTGSRSRATKKSAM